MLDPSRRGGVPVLRRPSLKPADFRDADSPYEAGSLQPRIVWDQLTSLQIHARRISVTDFMRPKGVVLRPTCISPPRKVPVEMMSFLHAITSPLSERGNQKMLEPSFRLSDKWQSTCPDALNLAKYLLGAG